MRGFWLAVAIALIVLHAAGGWIFSTRLLDQAFVVNPAAPADDVTVAAVGANTISLQPISDTDSGLERNQVMGLSVGDSYIRLGEVQSHTDDGTVIRSYQTVMGSAPAQGATGDIDGSAFPADPDRTGLEIDVVGYDSPLGPMEAWLIEGSRSEWVIHIHGKGASPREALRAMEALDGEGFHQLAITYRNDPGQPADPSGMYQYGREEWADLAAAVEFARDNGATEIILMGYSTGGAIAISYIYKRLDDVAALILDAPNLDMSATVDHNAVKEEVAFGIPPPVTLTATAKMLAGLRASINWNALDYAKRIGQLTTPTLIFHGTEDAWVPIDTSREVAEARPRFVTLVEVDGAGHVEAWNADPMAYEHRLVSFITEAIG